MNNFRAGSFSAPEEQEMSYAIIRSGGKQFRVFEGQTVRVPSIDAEAGETVELEALVVGGDGEGQVRFGTPAAKRSSSSRRSAASSTSARAATARTSRR